MARIRGNMETVPAINVGKSVVRIRTDVERIEEEDFTGWEYDEEAIPMREHISLLTINEDTEGIALVVSLLMGEIDALRARVEALEGGAE